MPTANNQKLNRGGDGQSKQNYSAVRTGNTDGSIKFGLIYLITLSVVIWFIAFYLFKIGYKIKS